MLGVMLPIRPAQTGALLPCAVILLALTKEGSEVARVFASPAFSAGAYKKGSRVDG